MHYYGKSFANMDNRKLIEQKTIIKLNTLLDLKKIEIFHRIMTVMLSALVN